MVDALESNPSGRRTIIRNHITTGISSQGHIAVPQPMTTATKTKKRTSKKDRIKSSTVAIYASVFTLVVSVVAMGYRAPQGADTSGAETVANTYMTTAKPSANDVVAAHIAASVASVAELSVAGSASESAISTEVQSLYGGSSSDANTIVKPTIVALSSASRDIQTYTVQAGDTVASIAARFGISEQTVRWANDLESGSAVKEGDVLDILPRDGVVYTVAAGDTVEKLAEKYKADATSILSANNLELSGLSEGLKIIIPGGTLPESERPGYVAPVPTYTASSSGFISGVGIWGGQVLNMYIFTGVDANDGGYANGNCTAYAYYRRAQLGRPIPGDLGNAYTWAVRAQAKGYTVNGNPAAGAVIQSGNHVGVVEEVLANGDLRITDMNYGYRVYNLATRIIPASTVHNYLYIH